MFIKPYVTVENCITGTFLSAVVAFIGYSLWKLNNNNKNSGEEVIKFDKRGWRMEQDESNIPEGTKNSIETIVNRIYNNRDTIGNSKDTYVKQIQGCMNLCAQGSAPFSRLNEFLTAFKEYRDNNGKHSQIRIKKAYKRIRRILKIN